MQEPHRQPPFQIGDMVGDRRFRDIEQIGRSDEAPRLDDTHENAHALEHIHGAYYPLITDN